MEHFLINNKVPPPERLLKQLDRPHSFKETNGTEERLHKNLSERQRTGLLKALKAATFVVSHSVNPVPVQ